MSDSNVAPSASVEAATSDLSGQAGEAALKASSQNNPNVESSVSPPEPEKKTTHKSSTSRAKKSTPTPGVAVSGQERDEVLFSRMVPASETRARKSLSVHHLQRRLMELGYGDAYADRDGSIGELTELSISAWQKDNGKDETGRLTPEEFEAIFADDPNVIAKVDVAH